MGTNRKEYMKEYMKKYRKEKPHKNKEAIERYWRKKLNKDEKEETHD